MLLKDKVALVTGSSRGIGRAIAIELAKQGATVIINYRSNIEQAQDTVNHISQLGFQAHALQADVSKPQAIITLFDEILDQYKRLDIIVNNAGKVGYSLIKDIDEEMYNSFFDTNVKSVFFILKEAFLKLSDNGRIINISSATTKMSIPAYGLYSSTKASIEHLTRTFAKEIVIRGITVNSVSPGPTITDAFMEGKNSEELKMISGMSVFNRIAETTDIAKVVRFLCTSDADWITAQNIIVDGGVV